MCNYLNLAEKDYFGLRYVDQEKQRVSQRRLVLLSLCANRDLLFYKEFLFLIIIILFLVRTCLLQF